MRRQRPARANVKSAGSTNGTSAGPASGAAASGATAHPTIPPSILGKLEEWCARPSPHRACASLRQALRTYRRAQGSHEEAPTAKVVAALYLLLVEEGDPLTIQERLRLDACLQPAFPLDAPSRAA
jgi:hypothetical protein